MRIVKNNTFATAIKARAAAKAPNPAIKLQRSSHHQLVIFGAIGQKKA
jgi:hypothetical protein